MSVNVNISGPMQVKYEWIAESFEIFSRDAVVWIASTIVAGGATLLPFIIFDGSLYITTFDSVEHRSFMSSSPYAGGSLSILGLALFLVCGSFFGTGLFGMANKAVRGERLRLNDLFSDLRRVPNFLAYWIVFSIVTYFSTFLCCVGRFFMEMLLFPGFAIVADGVGVGAALSMSSNYMKLDWFKGGVFAFVLWLILIASMVPVLLGLLVTVPMGIIISALAYNEMGREYNYSPPDGFLPPTSSTIWPPPPNVNPTVPKQFPDSGDNGDDQL